VHALSQLKRSARADLPVQGCLPFLFVFVFVLELCVCAGEGDGGAFRDAGAAGAHLLCVDNL